MAAPALVALAILAAPFWFEDSDRPHAPAPAASPASPSCEAGEGTWGTECVARDSFLVYTCEVFRQVMNLRDGADPWWIGYPRSRSEVDWP